MATRKNQNTEQITEQNIDTENTPKFNKAQILNSNWYSHRRDILTALLEDSKQYSHAEVNHIIKEFLEKEVK